MRIDIKATGDGVPDGPRVDRVAAPQGHKNNIAATQQQVVFGRARVTVARPGFAKFRGTPPEYCLNPDAGIPSSGLPAPIRAAEPLTEFLRDGGNVRSRTNRIAS
jgi:hypothetical protein